MFFSNIVIDTFIKGGPIMWPILLCSLIGVGVVVERIYWWTSEKGKRSPETLDKVYTALENNDLKLASSLARTQQQDPILRVIWSGLNHAHGSLENALQGAAAAELERAGKFLGIMDTIVTLGPLLGLLGTVTGIMHSFNFVGAEEVAAIKVSGGIAEALIATACGLVIAILCLVPYNFFTARLAKFQFELQTAATNVEVLLKASPTKS
jgi:biopolymer transport protein ExbB